MLSGLAGEPATVGIDRPELPSRKKGLLEVIATELVLRAIALQSERSPLMQLRAGLLRQPRVRRIADQRGTKNVDIPIPTNEFFQNQPLERVLSSPESRRPEEITYVEGREFDAENG